MKLSYPGVLFKKLRNKRYFGKSVIFFAASILLIWLTFFDSHSLQRRWKWHQESSRLMERNLQLEQEIQDLQRQLHSELPDEVIEQLEEREVGSGIDDWCDEVENIFDDLDELPNLDDGNYDEGDDSFSCSMVYEFDDFDELDEIYEAFGFVDVKDLDFDDENIEYNLDLEEVGAFVQALVSEDADIEFLWSVLVSGKLGENNADDVYDSKAVWEVDVDDSTELEMVAEKGGIPLIFILGGAGLLVLLLGGGIGAFFLIRGLRK